MYLQYYWMILPALFFGLYAQAKISNAFQKYSQVDSRTGMTGMEVARMILDRNGLRNVQVKPIQGKLTDHYDPRNNTVSLSSHVYHGSSIASMAVAAHEVGHAIQDAESYQPLRFRHTLFPVARLSSQMFWIFLFLGFLIHPMLLDIGVILFAFGVLFQLVTLPVEFNASKRALAQLEQGIAPEETREGSKKILTAAALTYVAAAAMAITQLLRILMMTRRRN